MLNCVMVPLFLLELKYHGCRYIVYNIDLLVILSALDGGVALTSTFEVFSKDVDDDNGTEQLEFSPRKPRLASLAVAPLVRPLIATKQENLDKSKKKMNNSPIKGQGKVGGKRGGKEVDSNIVECPDSLLQEGTIDSMVGVYYILKQFYLLSGLQLNVSKSELFVAKAPQEKLALMTTCSWFKVGRLPMRIQWWSTKHLSHVGRLQLIKAVIFSVQAYWSCQFLMPKSVFMKEKVFLDRLERRDHIFFECSFSIKIKEIVRARLEGGPINRIDHVNTSLCAF
ncbi:hypothetical protein PVK06_042848 [Gossypium arboreum]|uniref:Uncharacterized protein n=1 Tax=Gossypium arboreum TaxID=29729 RepID=A0ABR0MM48_GOSAR|nr:hypothetical protein PVK06_042848 [Gossypium arboreum]